MAHIVPLARQTLALFREWYGAQRGSGKGYVFAVKQDGPKRRAMLQAWADYLDGLKAGDRAARDNTTEAPLWNPPVN